MVRDKTIGSKIADVIIYLFLGIWTITCAAPILHVIALSFSDKLATASGSVYLLPKGFNLAAYHELLSDSRFWRAFMISVERVVIGTSLNFVLTVITAYPLSKDPKVFPQRQVYIWLIMTSMLISGGIIPMYMLVQKMGLIDTIWALILPGALPLFNAILIMNFFRGLPHEIEDAAIIDGANSMQILWKIYLPLAIPSLATITLFAIVGHWNDFMGGLLYMNRSDMYPLQSYIQQMIVVQNRDISMMTPEEIKRMAELSNKSLDSAKIVVSTLPIVALYPFCQKFFMTGITLGSVKS